MRTTSLSCWILLSLATASHAAQVTNESFTTGSNGWVGRTGGPFGETGEWAFTGSAAYVNFFNPGFAVPDSGTLSNGPTATSGSFTGNYDQAGINRISFSFLAPQIVPSGFVILEWSGSTSVYQRGFTVTATGVWHRFSASLADEARGQWTTLLGSSNDFEAARQSVRWVVIRVSRNGINDHSFVFDNLSLIAQPDASSLVADTGTTFLARWDFLRASQTYHVEAAPDVTGTWTTVQTFVATNMSQWISITNGGERCFWRIAP